MATLNGAVRAARFLFVSGTFVEGIEAAFDIGLVAKAGNHVGDDDGLGFAVGVEAVLGEAAFFYLGLAGFAKVEVVVEVGEFIEDEFGLVAIGVVVFGLDGVGLDDE